ncbi:MULTISPECIES: hypothetical protein [unclassified Cryobacterium]|nr:MULTISPECIES: hypothetical protein [unclassified Cryobacterium]
MADTDEGAANQGTSCESLFPAGRLVVVNVPVPDVRQLEYAASGVLVT